VFDDEFLAYEPLDWTRTPDEVDAAFERGDPAVGVDVLRLSLNHADPQDILPRIARAMKSDDMKVRRQGVIALAHVARLHRMADRECLDLLRAFPRGNEADDDLWQFVPHRRLPWWIWRYQIMQRIRVLLRLSGRR
jgi:hypothetical protein